MSAHLSIAELELLVRGSPDSSTRALLLEHVRGCPQCARRYQEQLSNERLGADIGRLLRPPPTEPPGESPTHAVTEAQAGDESLPPVPGYRLTMLLGRGGQGVVYGAIQRSTQRQVAVKVLLGGAFASPAARRRFEREIEIIAQLRHPHIVTVFDSGTTADGNLYYAMEHVAGQDILRYCGGAATGVRPIVSLFMKVCAGVEYAHRRGIIHRDLKPSNVLVDDDGSPRILDFGLAKLAADPGDSLASVAGQVIGTLPYVSPEHALGRGDAIDSRSDVYALGVILYELLSGRAPYPTDGPPAEVLRRVAELPPAPLSKARLPSGRAVDDELETIVLKALAKEPDRRYASAGLLGEDLGRYLRGEAIEAKRDSRGYVLRKTLSRHRLGVGVAAAAVALLAGIAVAMTIMAARTARSRNEAVAAGVQANEQKRRAEAALRESETSSYYNRITLAQREWQAGNVARTEELLDACPEELR